jgi:Asp/Glu/hydantoin racemase
VQLKSSSKWANAVNRRKILNVSSKYKFLLIPPFRLPDKDQFTVPAYSEPADKPREQRLLNSDFVLSHLEDVDWDLHPGAEPLYGNWSVETREEFAYAATARIDGVREACESGKYNGVILLGGGEPGFMESREIGRKYGVVVTANAFSQMYLATILGDSFSIIDIEGVHNVYYRDLIRTHQLQGRCRSIRNIGYSLPRPGDTDPDTLTAQCLAAAKGEPSVAVERAVDQAEAAIVEDGAEVITLGCSMTFWLQPYIRDGLKERGWDVPVLEGYTASIELAKLMINLGVNASGVTYMGPRSQRPLSKIFV